MRYRLFACGVAALLAVAEVGTDLSTRADTAHGLDDVPNALTA